MTTMMKVLLIFNGRRVSVFECAMMSEVFKVLEVEMTGGVLSSPAVVTCFGPFHHPTRKEERVLMLLRPRAQNVLVVLAQLETCHFGWDARHGLVHLAVFRV